MYKGLSDRINQGMDFIKQKAGKSVHDESQALSIYNDNYIPYNDVKSLVDDVINQYSSGQYNPARAAIPKQLSEIYNDILDFETNPATGGIRPLELHGLKQRTQDLANFEAQYPGIGNRALQNLSDKINEILRVYPEYAMANDEYSSIVELSKKLPTEKQLASSLADYNTSRNFLSGTQDILKQADEILPDDYKFLEDLKKAIALQENQANLKRNLPQGIFNDISRYDNAPLDIQAAFEKLNQNSPNNFIEKYKKLAEQQSELSE